MRGLAAVENDPAPPGGLESADGLQDRRFAAGRPTHQHAVTPRGDLQ